MTYLGDPEADSKRYKTMAASTMFSMYANQLLDNQVTNQIVTGKQTQ